MSFSSVDQRPRRALVFTPMETRRQVIVDAALQAEALGYEAVVIPEGWGLDATIVLSEIAMRTERIRLVAGILSIWGRSPATLAMTAASLDDLSNGRFTLGLGTSTSALAEGFHGASFRAPTDHLRNSISTVRALLNGDRSPGIGEVRGLRLGRPPSPDVPIWVAGLGPRTVATAAELGDGWLPAVVPRDVLPGLRRTALGEASTTNDPAVITCVMAAIDGACTPGRSAAEQVVGWYLTGMGPFYGDFCAAHGFATEVAAVRMANPRPKPGAISWPAAADRLLDQLAAFGDRDAVADQLRAWDRETDVVGVTIGPSSAATMAALIDSAAPTGSRVGI